MMGSVVSLGMVVYSRFEIENIVAARGELWTTFAKV